MNDLQSPPGEPGGAYSSNLLFVELTPIENGDLQCPFQHGQLGLTNAKLRGHIIIKTKSENQDQDLQVESIACRLRILEMAPSQGVMQHFDMQTIVWTRTDDPLPVSIDDDVSTMRVPFALELPDDAPQCFHMDGANLHYILSAIVESVPLSSTAATAIATISESELEIHVKRYSSSNDIFTIRQRIANVESEDASTSTSTPVTLPTTLFSEDLDELEYQFYLPKRLYTRGEIVPMAVFITPKRKANNSLHTGVRNVSAQLIRKVAAADDAHLQESGPGSSSSLEDLITMTGKGCRFSNFRPIRLRLYLRIPPDAEVATLRTTFQNVRMYVRISIGVIGRDDIVLEKEIGILVDDAMPRRSAAPEADDEEARIADEKRRLPWDIDIEGEFDGYDDGVGDRIEADPAPQYGGLASSHDTTLGTGSSSQKYDEAFASSGQYDTNVLTIPETDAWSVEDREEGVDLQMTIEEAPPPISEDTHMPAPPYMGEHEDEAPMTRPRGNSHASLLDQDQTYVLALQAYQRQQMEESGAQRTFDLQDLSHHDDDDHTATDSTRVPTNGVEGDLPAYGDVNSSISVGYGGLYPPMNSQQPNQPHQQAVQHHHNDRCSPPPPPSLPLPLIPTDRLLHAVSTALTHPPPAESTTEPPLPPPPIDFVRVGEHGRLIAVESVPPPYRE